MLKIGFLRTSLRGLLVIPTSPTLRISPHTSLHVRHDARVEQVALVVSRTYSTAPSSSKLVLSGELNKFPLGFSNFRKIRQFPGLAYFDKTSYIPLIARGPEVQLFCRPRRFGKSLTVSMLQYFHGVEFRDQYNQIFKDLDVDRAVKGGEVMPGEYLVLNFDFSRINRSPPIEQTTESLTQEINQTLLDFKDTYAKYLGESFESKLSRFIPHLPVGNLRILITAVHHALQGIHNKGNNNHPLFGVKGIYLLADEYDACANEYMNPHDPGSWSGTKTAELLKGFWSVVKAGKKDYYGIDKVYMTGVTPLLLSDLTSGANEQENTSFDQGFSAMCGLTRSDVLGALEVICNNEEEVQEHLRKLVFYANGYRFCRYQDVEPVFNTQTALSYLQAVKLQKMPQIEDPPNSEVSEPFLRICAGAPAAVQDMQFALQKDEHGHFRKIRYEKVLSSFKLSELASGEGDISAWRSLMVYMGGLTFDSHDPSNLLTIPNLVAAQRFGYALLSRVGLYSSMTNALRFLRENGNVKDVLTGYRRLMRQRDVGSFAFGKTEEDHRDSIWYAILENPALAAKAEYQVKKWSNRRGYVDLLIEDKGLYTVLEFKNIQIRYLGLVGKSTEDKARQLEDMMLKEILQLRFKNDQFRSGTIYDWFDGDDHEDEDYGKVRKQLQSYIMGSTVQEEIAGKNFRAFAVVILGSRQILMREMGRDGKWVGEFQLA